MNIRSIRAPDRVVYVALYGIIFGVSVVSLIRDRESPNNWVLYVGMAGAVAAAAVKLRWPRQRRTWVSSAAEPAATCGEIRAETFYPDPAVRAFCF